MPTVFVPNEPDPRRVPPGARAYNVHPAEKYGRLRYVFYSKDKSPSRRDFEHVINHAYESLKNAQQGDYLVTVGGDPLGIVVAAIVLADLTKGKFNYLCWDRYTNEYKPATLDFKWDH